MLISSCGPKPDPQWMKSGREYLLSVGCESDAIQKAHRSHGEMVYSTIFNKSYIIMVFSTEEGARAISTDARYDLYKDRHFLYKRVLVYPGRKNEIGEDIKKLVRTNYPVLEVKN